MKTKKSFILITLLFTALFFVSGCGSDKNVSSVNEENQESQQTDEQAYTLKLANYFGSDHPHNIAMNEKFKPLVEERSNGALIVEIYDNSQLGAEEEIYNGVRSGTIEMGILGTVMSNEIEKMNVGDMPFLFNDLDHAKKVFTGEIGEEIASELESEAGVRVLAWSVNGFRAFSSNHPIEKIEDFNGMRLRMPNIPNYVKMGELLGANVTPMPISEIFTALEQNVIDGQDNPIATLRTSGWYEVQDYVLESQHVFNPSEYVINIDVWNNLSSEQQKVLQEAALETAEYQWELYRNSYEDDKKFLEEQGITFITPSEKFKEDIESSMQPLYDEIFGNYSWAEEMVKRIKEIE